MFRKNYPLQKDSTLQEIRWYQWENVVNSAGKTWLEKVLKEALIDMYDSLCAQLPSFIAHYYIKQKTKWSLCAKFKRSQRNWFCQCFTAQFFWKFFRFLAGWSTDKKQNAKLTKKQITTFFHDFGTKIYGNLQL